MGTTSRMLAASSFQVAEASVSPISFHTPFSVGSENLKLPKKLAKAHGYLQLCHHSLAHMVYEIGEVYLTSSGINFEYFSLL